MSTALALSTALTLATTPPPEVCWETLQRCSGGLDRYAVKLETCQRKLDLAAAAPPPPEGPRPGWLIAVGALGLAVGVAVGVAVAQP